MVKWFTSFIILMIIVSSVIGCGGNEEEQEKENQTETQTKQEKKEGDQFYTAHYIEEEIETLDEVTHATVVVQNKDAYVAVDMLQKELDEETKNKIVSAVRTSEPGIQNINISNNQDLNTRLRGLAREIERGEPAKAIGDSFEQTIRRYFPELKR